MVPQGNAFGISHTGRKSDRLCSRSGHRHACAPPFICAKSNASCISFPAGCSSKGREAESFGPGHFCARDTATVVDTKAIPGDPTFR